MGRRLTTPQIPVVHTQETVEQHIGRLIIEPVVMVNQTTGELEIDRARTAITYEVNDVAADARLLKAASRSVLFADWPPAVRQAAVVIRDWLLQHADGEGLLAPGTDEPE